jgi:hypothetical protein
MPSSLELPQRGGAAGRRAGQSAANAVAPAKVGSKSAPVFIKQIERPTGVVLRSLAVSNLMKLQAPLGARRVPMRSPARLEVRTQRTLQERPDPD